MPGETTILKFVGFDYDFEGLFHFGSLKTPNAVQHVSHHCAVFDRVDDNSHLLNQRVSRAEPLTIPKELPLHKSRLVARKDPDRWTDLFCSALWVQKAARKGCPDDPAREADSPCRVGLFILNTSRVVDAKIFPLLCYPKTGHRIAAGIDYLNVPLR